MICIAGRLVNMTSKYLSCASMSWFKGSLGIQTLACAATSAASIIRPSWRSTTDTSECNLKLQSPHVLSSPENTGGFPILVSMIPRPAGVVGGGASAPPDGSTGGKKLFRPQPLDLLQIVALLCSQSSDFTEECLHHLCLSLPLGLSLSPLLSCHVHD